MTTKVNNLVVISRKDLDRRIQELEDAELSVLSYTIKILKDIRGRSKPVSVLLDSFFEKGVTKETFLNTEITI